MIKEERDQKGGKIKKQQLWKRPWITPRTDEDFAETLVSRSRTSRYSAACRPSNSSKLRKRKDKSSVVSTSPGSLCSPTL